MESTSEKTRSDAAELGVLAQTPRHPPVGANVARTQLLSPLFGIGRRLGTPAGPQARLVGRSETASTPGVRPQAGGHIHGCGALASSICMRSHVFAFGAARLHAPCLGLV